MRPNDAGNIAFLLGAGWTLAVVAALALFKSSSIEPIYLWTQGIVGLGWWGILLHALAAEQRAASAAAARGEPGAALDHLAQAVGAEMRRASSELLRVDELLAHAIAQLISAFNSLGEEMGRHQHALAQDAAAAPGTDAARRLREADERVARDVNGAVTALQFRDVAGQKLGHVRRELEALEQVMQRIRQVSAAQSGLAAAAGRAQLATKVQGLLQELEQARAASPAQQELMQAGGVELF